MEPQKPGNSSGFGPEFIKRHRVANERAVQRVHVQNEIAGVLGQVFAGAARRILDSANPNLQALQEGFSILPILQIQARARMVL